MSGLTTQQRAQLRATDQWKRRSGVPVMGGDFYVSEPVRRVARRVIRPGLIVSTVIACGSAETVIFTKSSRPGAHKGFEVEVVHGPPDRADAQHVGVVMRVLFGEAVVEMYARVASSCAASCAAVASVLGPLAGSAEAGRP
ncbi:hypothetical protein [Cellulomonas iranensis]|uniref:hypothetical protein n=1 Tax=Cellulomonas iranensis TaxID=76862 RepID=UPI000B3BE5A2|nr:hypothetical protein [Cellulomonas iranensis]